MQVWKTILDKYVYPPASLFLVLEMKYQVQPRTHAKASKAMPAAAHLLITLPRMKTGDDGNKGY